MIFTAPVTGRGFPRPVHWFPATLLLRRLGTVYEVVPFAVVQSELLLSELEGPILVRYRRLAVAIQIDTTCANFLPEDLTEFLTKGEARNSDARWREVEGYHPLSDVRQILERIPSVSPAVIVEVDIVHLALDRLLVDESLGDSLDVSRQMHSRRNFADADRVRIDIFADNSVERHRPNVTLARIGNLRPYLHDSLHFLLSFRERRVRDAVSGHVSAKEFPHLCNSIRDDACWHRVRLCDRGHRRSIGDRRHLGLMLLVASAKNEKEQHEHDCKERAVHDELRKSGKAVTAVSIYYILIIKNVKPNVMVQ